MTELWNGLLLSERTYRVGDPDGITELRDELRAKKKGLLTLDPGGSGALLAFDRWWDRPALGKPYAAFAMASDRMVERAGQAADEVDAGVLVCEAGYLSIRQPSSIQTARRAGIAIGAVVAHAGIQVHVVFVQPQTWQSFALVDLPASADSGARKRGAIELASSPMAAAYATTGNVEQRSGFADAWGMGLWWQRAPLRSPIRRK